MALQIQQTQDEQQVEQRLRRALAADLNAPHWQLLIHHSQFVGDPAYKGRPIEAVVALNAGLSSVLSDLDAVGWLLERIFRQFEEFDIDNPGEMMRLMHQIALDIEMFHAKVLLVTDCLAQSLVLTATQKIGPDSVQKLDFGGLKRRWRGRKIQPNGIDPEVFSQFFDCPWRKDFSELRNIMLHGPSFTMPLPKSDDNKRLAFGLHDKANPFAFNPFFSKYPRLLMNQNAAYFDSYAGAYLGCLFDCLADLAPHLLQWFGRTDFPKTHGASISQHMMRICMERALADVTAA